MSEKFPAIGEEHRAFIERQKMYFVATAAPEGRVNLSPKGGDSFRVIAPNKVVWLNLTGSGNETAAHVSADSRMTVMFCSFEKTPQILRLYGQAKVHHARGEGWRRWIGLFPEHAGARQVMELDVDLVQTSCGYAVPRYDFLEHRPTLDKWSDRKGAEGIRTYWQEKNRESLDGLPIHIPKEGE